MAPNQGANQRVQTVSNNNPKKIKIDSKMVPFSLRERLHELTGNEFMLWMCLFLHSDREGEAYPSNKVLMEETGISERNLVRLKQSLRKKGWLPKSTQRYRDNGSLSSMNEKVAIPAKLAPIDTCQNDTHIPAKFAPMSLPEWQVGYLPNCGGLEVPTVEVPNIEEPNSKDELVSKLVSSDGSLRSPSTTSPCGEGGDESQEHTPTPIKFDDNPDWEPVETRLKAAGYESIYKLPCYNVLHEEFGVQAGLSESSYQRMLDINKVMNYEGMDTDELRRLIRWSFQHPFWKKRILSVASLSKAMTKGILADESGGVHEKALVPQFRRSEKNKALKTLDKIKSKSPYHDIVVAGQAREAAGAGHGFDVEDAE